MFNRIPIRCVYYIFFPAFQDKTGILGLVRRFLMTGAFLIGSPWLLRWWGPSLFINMWYYHALQGKSFELNYDQILADHRKDIKGVIHVGANVGQEVLSYANQNIQNVLWIEAQPSLVNQLTQNVSSYGRGHQVFIAAVSDVSDKPLLLHCTNNGISSSLFPLGKGHQQYLPFIEEVETIPVFSITLKDLFYRNKIDPMDYTFMYLDTQGSELSVLKGCGDQIINSVKHIVTEISAQEHYQGGAQLHDIDQFLSAYGFVRVQTNLPPTLHGNALYSKVEQ